MLITKTFQLVITTNRDFNRTLAMKNLRAIMSPTFGSKKKISRKQRKF